MLMLAVAAGESGANPELSRNGVLVHVLCTGVSPRTCRQRAPAVRPGCLTSGPRGVGRWTRRRARSCAAPCPPPGPLPSEGVPHVTIAPADPASAIPATEATPVESDGPGAALLRTLT